jgi:hypothetical protein
MKRAWLLPLCSGVSCVSRSGLLRNSGGWRLSVCKSYRSCVSCAGHVQDSELAVPMLQLPAAFPPFACFYGAARSPVRAGRKKIP